MDSFQTPKIKSLTLKPYKGQVEFVLFSDLQLGNAAADLERAQETIDYVASSPGRYMFLGGDILENVTPQQSGMLLDQTDYPNEQLDKVVDMLAPVRKKIVGSINSNHGARSVKAALFDIDRELAARLNVPYFKVGGLFKIFVGDKISYNFAYQHGRSGAKNPLGELYKMAQIYRDADICALAHIHRLIYERDISFTIDSRGKEHPKITHLLRTGCYLAYADYARYALMSPSVIGSPIIRLSSKEKDIKIDIDLLSWTTL